MHSRMAITYALVLALGTGVYAASAQMSKTAESAQDTPSHGVPLSWVPDWLVKPLSRAIADATDPRQRSKETGAPME